MEIILGILLTVVTVTVFGVAYEQLMRRRDKQRMTELPGELLTINGRNVHVQRDGMGQPGPTVVLLTTIGGTSLDWQLVQPEVAKFAPVISYDRAGYGWSEDIPGERVPELVVEELELVLQAANMRTPYVVVGHGFGGLYTRLYQANHPEQVAGIVLVDSSHPELVIENDHRKELNRQRNILRFRRIGILRRMLPRVVDWVKSLPSDVQKQYLAVRMHDIPMTLKEAVPIFRDGVDVPDDLNDLPMRVISRSLVEEIEFSRRWREYQEDLATLSTQAEFMPVEKGNHYLQFNEPEVVIAAVKSIVEEVRNGGQHVNNDALTGA